MNKDVKRAAQADKPELLKRFDARVVLQKAAAYRIARALGMAFCPVTIKKDFVGYLVSPAAIYFGVPAEYLNLTNQELKVRFGASLGGKVLPSNLTTALTSRAYFQKYAG